MPATGGGRVGTFAELLLAVPTGGYHHSRPRRAGSVEQEAQLPVRLQGLGWRHEDVSTVRVRHRVMAARLAAQRYARTLVLRSVAAAAVAVVEGGVAAALLTAGSGGLAEVLQHALTLLLLQTDVLSLQVPPVLPHVRVGHPAELVV